MRMGPTVEAPASQISPVKSGHYTDSFAKTTSPARRAEIQLADFLKTATLMV